MGDRCWSSNCHCEFAIEFGSGMEIHFYPNNDGGALAVSQNSGIVGSASLSTNGFWPYVADPNRHTDFYSMCGNGCSARKTPKNSSMARV